MGLMTKAGYLTATVTYTVGGPILLSNRSTIVHNALSTSMGNTLYQR